MAHTRKDTLTASPYWGKHVRPSGKRRIAHKERRAAKASIREEI